METASGPLRIGEFALRVDTSPHLLRAWERRYGLLQPVRSPGGYRLYTAEDAARVERMRQGLAEGLSAADAAQAALARSQPSVGAPGDTVGRLVAAIDRYDEDAANALLDESLAAFGLEVFLRDVIFPTLTAVGLRWEPGTTVGVSEEHFASNLIRGRLLSLARLWSRGRGPLALLACAPGEAHDITLLAFGLLLRSHGWRILFLGADTPISTFAHTAETARPALAVLTTFDPAPLQAEKSALRRLTKTVPLALAGPGSSDALCAALGVRRLDGDVIAAAHLVSRAESR